jgi:anti-sigma regulatory factor (Ser/Thr protein kinase)
MTPPELELALPARAENVIVIRQAVAGLGEAVGMDPQRVDDLKTAVTEACNNVVVHAYGEKPGPLFVSADAGGDSVEVAVTDHGRGFRPRAADSEDSLGIGLPLIASLSDSFEIRGGAGEGTTTRIRFSLVPGEEPSRNGDGAAAPDGLELAAEPGDHVRPVLARVIGALGARAAFSMDRLSDTMLLGDAVSAHRPEDFAAGKLELAIWDGDGTLKVRVGPLVDGGGERLLAQMKIPGQGSLESLARSVEVTRDTGPSGEEAEYLLIQVDN